MVLIVVAHVPGQEVERPVVGVSFVALDEHVVLRDEVARQGVEPHGQERAQHQVGQRLGSQEVPHGKVSAHLDDNVDDLQEGQPLGAHKEGAKGVEVGLEEQPDQLGERVLEEAALKLRGDVHVLLRVTLVTVVLQVVLLERDGHGHPQRQVGEEAEDPIG